MTRNDDYDSAIEYAYRKLAGRIVVTAIRDLALYRRGDRLRRGENGMYLFGPGITPYPEVYFRQTLPEGTKVPLGELKIFFESEWFDDLALALGSTLGFKLKGQTILRKRKFPKALLKNKTEDE